MSGRGRRDHKAAEVRRMLETDRPAVPGDLVPRATELGVRLLHRRRAVHRVLWTLLFVAVIVFTVWASVAHPWAAPPAETTPPLEW
ncbi:hypothetical protein [Streptomyces lushanensis]|uniref:hypothetical protein n=1 Tax=Streptomyces lushanensis TaxID=1434255 RepID=UPI000834068C|nr:hypothetical protein [Streptomyces lushanensis]